jgi:Sec-independent protein translocase protein TatA
MISHRSLNALTRLLLFSKLLGNHQRIFSDCERIGGKGFMYGLGMGEILLILIIAFFIVGPADLTKVGRFLGRCYKILTNLSIEARKALDLDSEYDEIIDVKREIEQISNDINPEPILRKEKHDLQQVLRKADLSLEAKNSKRS